MADDERTLGRLVAEISEDLSALVRYELALAKSEIKSDLKRGGIAGGLAGAAGAMVLLSFITLVIAAGYGLVAAGLPAWAAFLIVTGGLLLIALFLVGLAYLLVRRIKPPERTIASSKLTIAALRGGGKPAAGP